MKPRPISPAADTLRLTTPNTTGVHLIYGPPPALRTNGLQPIGKTTSAQVREAQRRMDERLKLTEEAVALEPPIGGNPVRLLILGHVVGAHPDAAHALGLTRGQSLRHVILPQTVRRVLPPLAGQMISLVKDSAIVSVISIQELTYQGTQLMASTYLTIEVWLTVALMYFLLTWPCSLLVGRLERRFSPDR